MEILPSRTPNTPQVCLQIPNVKNTRTRSRVILAVSAAVLIQSSAFAADFIKLENTTALNLTGAWSSFDDADGIPDADDTLNWDFTFTTPVNPRTANALSALGGDLSVQGIRVTNVGGTRNAASLAIGFQNASSANTLTIGSGGIDMSSATQVLYLESKIALSANQDWFINNANTNANPTGFNNGEDLSFRAQSGSTTAASTAFNLGGFTVNTSGTGTANISSGYAVTNGTINVGNSLFLISGGDSRLVTVGSNVNLNVASGSTLHFQSNSAGVTSSANITLNGGTLKLVNNNAANQVTIGGTTNVNSASTLLVGNNVGNGSVASTNGVLFNSNLTGSAPLTVTNNASTVSTLIMGGNNSAYSGTLTFGGTSDRVTRLTTANSGSAAATWSISSGHILQVNGVAVELGTLNGAGTVNSSSGAATINVGSGNFSGTIVNGSGTVALTKSTSGTLTLTGANTYTGATNVNAGTLLVSPGVLGTTAVSVANGATFAVQASTSGTLNTSSISLVDGGTLIARPLAVGAAITVSSLTVGTATGGTVTLDTGTLGSPTVAPLIATTFNPAAGTKIQVAGTNLTAGTFPLIGYTTLGGGGFAGLTLSLPFRVAGSLVNNANSIAVNITGAAKPVWRGGINGNWNIDTTGNGGAGTANWAATAGPNTYVESPTLGNDAVLFDDTVTGTRNVNLTTTLSPAAITVNNSTGNYTFSGSGKISGSGSLTKSGTGTLTVVNTGANDYSGGTTISGGTIRVGDGTTNGAGSLGGTVTVNSPGVLELNRPDDFTLSNAITGTGSLTKSQANIATISSAQTFGGTVTLGAGTLQFTGGGNLSGKISGSGTLEVAGGTLQFSGTDANTMSGTTAVSSGTLQLNKTGVDAISGTLAVSGTGAATFSQPNQVADTATVTYDKVINGGSLTFNQPDTIGALTILNGNDTNAQVLSNNNGFAVAGLVTVQNTGVYSVASNSSASVGGLNLSGSAVIRVSANSNPSTLTVGTLGITGNGGTIQVGQGTGAFDAVLNLNGDVTTTGNLSFTDGNFTGTNLRQINIGAATRTFNIDVGTTTTVAPDIAGTGGITKKGDGILFLTNRSASTYTGPTVIEAGTLSVAGSISGTSSITVKQGAIFDVSAGLFLLGTGQSLRGTGDIFGFVSLDAGAKLEPGEGRGTLNFSGDLDLTLGVTPANSGALQFELGGTANSDKIAFTTGALTIGTGVLGFDDFAFSTSTGFGAGTYTLFDGGSAIFGTLDSAHLSGLLGGGFTGTLGFADNGNDLVLTVVPEPGSTTLLMAGVSALVGMRRFRRRSV